MKFLWSKVMKNFCIILIIFSLFTGYLYGQEKHKAEVDVRILAKILKELETLKTKVDTIANDQKKKKEKLITMEFERADIVSLFRKIATIGNLNLIIGKDVKGKTSVRLKSIDPISALEIIARSNGYSVQLQAGYVYWITKKFTSKKTKNGGVYITMNVRQRKAREIIKKIAKIANVNIIVPSSLQDKITLKLKRVHWQNAILSVLRGKNCKLILEKANLYRIIHQAKISIETTNKNIRSVIKAIAKQAGIKIILPSYVRGKVTIKMMEVDWQDALKAILKNGNYGLILQDANIYKVVKLR